MTVGNAAGGYFSDRDLRRSILGGFVVFIGAMVVFALVAGSAAGLFIGAFLIGASGLFLGPAMQSRLISVAPGAQLMGAAVNQSAMNIANSLGAALGGLVIARGWGYVAPAWVGVALGVVGLVLAAVSFAVEDRTARRAATREPALALD